jgi:2-aminoadipate transaminase
MSLDTEDLSRTSAVPGSTPSFDFATGAPAAPAALPGETPWSDRYALRTRGMTSSAIRELLKLTADPGILSFGGGLPAPEVFPVAELEAAARRVLAGHGAEALQYGPTEGYLPLRELLARHMARYAIRVTPDNILITAGAQQALDLIGKLFLNAGDHVLTEQPTYLGALQAWNAYQAQYLPVPIDDDGMRMDGLEEALRHGPKFLYVLPNFQNPGGVTLARERRQRLVELASHYGAPIVEDDPYGQLRYEGSHLPSLVQLDAQLHGAARANGAGRPFRGGVLYLGTLSKVLAPGLRVGWVVAPEEVIARMVQMKQGMDLHTSTFTQMVAWETARGGFLDRHVRTIRTVYAERRDAMLAALERHMPPGVSWTRPHGGLFLWVTLPPGLDAEVLLADALREKVAFVPGRSFFPNGGGEGTLRLNFSYCRPELIAEGMHRLGGVVARRLGG